MNLTKPIFFYQSFIYERRKIANKQKKGGGGGEGLITELKG